MWGVTLIVSIAAFVLILASMVPAWGVPLWVGTILLSIAVLLMQIPK